MLSLALLCLAAPSVPDVVMGPDTSDRALRVDAPISRVTVFADRARVTRRGSTVFPKGASAIALPDVIGAAFVDSIRVSVDGAKVLRVESAPVLRERFGIESAEKLLKEIEAVDAEIQRREARQSIEQQEISSLAALVPSGPVSEADRDGRALLAIKPEAWLESQRVLGERRARAAERARAIQVELEKLWERRQRLVEEIGRQDLGGFTDRKYEVVALVAAEREAKGAIELEYFVPAASWTPAYAVSYDSSKSEVELSISGRVTQATGEPWQDVKMELSTAVPGLGIAVPELLTWTLGEKRDFLPIARPKNPPPPPPPIVLPVVRPRPADLDRANRLALLKEQLRRVVQGGPAAGELGFEESTKAAPEKKIAASRPPPPPPPRPRAAAPSARAPREDAPMAMPSVAEESERDYGSSVLSTQMAYETTVASQSDTRRTSMGLHDPADFGPPPGGPLVDPGLLSLPGGFEHVFVSPATVDVSSAGELVRVPLEVERLSVETFYEATPSISTIAYLRAKVRNKGARPLLAGPVEIFVGRDFAGDGRIDTTGPGGLIELPLGADEDVRLLRRVVPKTQTEGFLSKSDVTTYSIEIDVGNYKKKPISVVIHDQIPKTTHEDIEVKLLDAEPRPFETSAEGIMSFRVEVAPSKTRTIKLRYQIARPRDWQLYQR
ncbi:MAG: DUF4139 domain-containing protein [Deltaproteobacteria bacterium]|nr:DUF4139 domain-containing protein [Deltaproteobacteria bacterium]